MTVHEFEVAKRGTDPIPFRFSDEPDYEYTFTPTKSARGTLEVLDADLANDPFIVSRKNRDWLVDGLPEDQWDHIKERLVSKTDDLSWPDVDKVIDYLTAQVRGRPPG